MNSKNERLQTVQWVFERQLAWIAAADAKVAVVITLDLALIAALGALGASEKAEVWSRPDNAWAAVLTVLTLIPLIISLGCAAHALIPRPEGPPASMLFFGRVVNQQRADYVAKLAVVTDDELLGDFAEQVHRNAEIACDKFKYVRIAMVMGFLALPFWILAVLAMMNRTS